MVKLYYGRLSFRMTRRYKTRRSDLDRANYPYGTAWYGHPRYDSGKKLQQPLHILKAEMALGRTLRAGESVHHVDNNKLNHHNTNLVIYEGEAYHHLLHARTDVLRAGGDPNTQRLCVACEQLRPIQQLVCECKKGKTLRQRLRGTDLSVAETLAGIGDELSALTEHRLHLPADTVRRLSRDVNVQNELETIYINLPDWQLRDIIDAAYERFFMTTDECLYPRCVRPLVARGLCTYHYQAAARLVKQGKTTWTHLERHGKVLRPYSSGHMTHDRDDLNAFQEWMATDESTEN